MRRKAKGPTARARAKKGRARLRDMLLAYAVVDVRAQNCCEVCGRRVHDAGEHHHVKPRSTHPELRTVASNIILTCRPCHLALTEHRITYEAQP